MSESSWKTCWEILPKVSRSFAIPIRMLPRRTGDAVMLAYLIFRIADTIEDCCPNRAEQRRLFQIFRDLLTGNKAGAAALSELAPPIYDVLMTRTAAVADCFDVLPEKVQAILLESLEEMSEGMQSWAQREVRSLDDLHDYCYYVAGIVGKLLTRLFHAYGHIPERVYPKLQERAVDFGIALQMINVIRDVREDDEEGRHYWPTAVLRRQGLTWEDLFKESHREQAEGVLRDLARDALRHSDAALEYLTLLPRRQIRVRLFCALPLYMAVWTIKRCLKDPALFSGAHRVKITRRKTRHIFAMSILLSPINGFLKSWYRRLRAVDRSKPCPQVQP